MSEEKKIFDPKFVHFMWDDELHEKKGFLADSIPDIIAMVEDHGPKMDKLVSVHSYSKSGDKPFTAYGDVYHAFFYHDPLYEVKWAWKQGRQIESKPLNPNFSWVSDKNPAWSDGYEYRIKPEETWRACKDVDELKKVWINKMPFDVLDTGLEEPLIWIRSKSNPSCTRLINGYNDLDVAIGDDWITVVELFREWEFLDGSPIGVEEWI